MIVLEKDPMKSSFLPFNGGDYNRLLLLSISKTALGHNALTIASVCLNQSFNLLRLSSQRRL